MTDQPTDTGAQPEQTPPESSEERQNVSRHSNMAALAFVLSLIALIVGFGRQFISYELRDVSYIVGLVYLGFLALSLLCALISLLALWMSKWRTRGLDPALTAIGFVALCLLVYNFPDLEPTAPSTVEDPLAACKANIDMIAKGLGAYADRHGQWPYDARGPLYSLSLLYPAFVADPVTFVCPTKLENEQRRFPIGCSLAGKQCSYGYDNEFDSLRTKPDMPMAGDMVGNHAEGSHVITFDKGVSFTNEFLRGEDPQDNIYVADEGIDPEAQSDIRQ